MKHPGHTYGGFVPPISERGMTRLLVSWCVANRCDMAGSDEDCGRSKRLGAEDQ
jgi:hypothetical protein